MKNGLAPLPPGSMGKPANMKRKLPPGRRCNLRRDVAGTPAGRQAPFFAPGRRGGGPLAQIRPFGGGNQRGGRGGGAGGFGGKVGKLGRQRPGGPTKDKGADFGGRDRFRRGNLDPLPAIPDNPDRIPCFTQGGFKLPLVTSGREGMKYVQGLGHGSKHFDFLTVVFRPAAEV